MNTFVLNSETANSSVESLLQKAAEGSIEVRDAQGNVVAYVLSPQDREAWIDVEANVELDQHRDEVRRALQRRGGVTTEQLLKNAASARTSDKAEKQ